MILNMRGTDGTDVRMSAITPHAHTIFSRITVRKTLHRITLEGKIRDTKPLKYLMRKT